MIALRRVRLQRQIGEDFAEEQPGAEIQRHQVAVLALPAEAGGIGEVLFPDRRGVDENLYTCLQVVVQPTSQRLQARLVEVVLVGVGGMDGTSRVEAEREEERGGECRGGE